MRNLRRRIIVWAGILLLSILLIIGGMQFVLFKINQNREQIITQLKQEFGFPLNFSTVEARWRGFSLGVSVVDVVVLDSEAPIPFITIKNLILFPDMFSLLFEKEPRLKKIILQNPNVVMGWDNKNDVSILGLKGELLPTTIDYKVLMASLSKLQTLVVEGANIEWRSSTREIRQLLSGKFEWINAKSTDWKFAGTQQLQIRKDLNLPAVAFNLRSSTHLKNIGLTLDGNEFFVQCDLALSADKQWQIDCLAKSHDLNIAEMRAYYAPLKTDLPLLQWLYEALSKGKITKAQMAINGPLNALKKSGQIHFKSTDFQYTPGWPKIEQARGSVMIENDRVLVNLVKGSIMGAPIQRTSAEIAPIQGTKTPIVTVEGFVASTVERGLLFLQKSPLRASIAQQLEPLNPRGFMHLTLKCVIPLDTQPVKVAGSILVKNGQLDIPGWHQGLNQLNGAFQFSEAALEASNIKAELDHLPLSLRVKTITVAKQKNIEIAAETTLSSAFLQQTFSIPFLQKLQGQSLFTLLLNKPLSDLTPTWSLSSNLEGMKIDLPGFLGKTSSEKVPMTLNIAAMIKGERKIALQLSKRLDLKFVTTGSINDLNIKNGQLEGPYIKGSFAMLSSKETGKEQSKQIEINLAYLKILSSHFALDAKKNTSSSLFEKTAIHFYCKNFQYDQSNFGEVSFKLSPTVYGYRIQDLLLESTQSELSGHGEWHLVGEEGVYTTLQGQLKSIDMGATLSRWDYPSAIRESSGVIQYQFRWPKHPYQFKLGIVDGTASLKFNKGRILGVDPGLGRIMGLLNLENIYRRLKLDFSDLVKKGFVFDTLKGDFRFQAGIAKTDKLSIDGPAAKITLTGKADMNTKAVDLEIAVTPHVGAGLPIAAAIAVGNPAVGAGLWIIDKLTGSKINKITRHRYHVTGTWDAPSVAETTSKEVDARKEQ